MPNPLYTYILNIYELVIYKVFCLDVAQGHMKGALNET